MKTRQRFNHLLQLLGRRQAADRIPPAPPRGPGDVYELGGREYVEIGEATAEHQFWLMGQIAASGVQSIETGEDEDVDAMARRVTAALLTGPVFVLFGGLLIPNGSKSEEWTPELAARTTAELRAIRDPQEVAVLRALTASLMAGFFAAGLASVKTSPTSSQSTSSRTSPGPAAGVMRDASASATASSDSFSELSPAGTSIERSA